MGERRPSDRPLCWGGMDVLKPPGHRPNVRQSVHILGNCSELYWNLSPVCVCVCVCVCFPAPTGKMTHNRKESRTKQHRQVGKECVRRCFCLAVWVQEIGCRVSL